MDDEARAWSRSSVAYAIIEAMSGRAAAEHAKNFVTGNWTDALKAADAVTALRLLAFNAPPDGERVEAIALDVAETITAHMRSPDMIWGLGRIDPELLDEMEAELRSVTVAALENALTSLSLSPHQGDREAIARCVEQARFLCDRLDELDWCDLDRTANDFSGHVDPVLSRLKSTLSLLQAPPPTDEGIAG